MYKYFSLHNKVIKYVLKYIPVHKHVVFCTLTHREVSGYFDSSREEDREQDMTQDLRSGLTCVVWYRRKVISYVTQSQIRY